jgi:CheY-like chemotaxis protein
LSLVRTIIQLHGGSSAVSSQGLGKGSRFTIILPMAQEQARLPVAAAAPPSAVRKILIIEDNVDANEIMAMLLQMQGHEVSSSFDGASGLRMALEGTFDVVLCDIGLPGLNGLEVVAALKAALHQHPPCVIATTGYSDAAQCDLARAAGFDHYLVKPLHLPALFKVIGDAPLRPAPDLALTAAATP